MPVYTNCPNCGAPRSGAVCEYCGTRHNLGGSTFVQLFAPSWMVFDESMTTTSAVLQEASATTQATVLSVRGL